MTLFTAVCELRYPAKLSWRMIVAETTIGLLLSAGFALLVD